MVLFLLLGISLQTSVQRIYLGNRGTISAVYTISIANATALLQKSKNGLLNFHRIIVRYKIGVQQTAAIIRTYYVNL